MFLDIFFLFFVLLGNIIVNEAPPWQYSTAPFLFSLFITIGIYICTLLLISLQNWCLAKRALWSEKRLLFLANGEFILFFLGGRALFWNEGLNFFLDNPFQPFVSTVITLLLYFVAIGVFYVTRQMALRRKRNLLGAAKQKIRFLLPFTIAFLLYQFLAAMIELIPIERFMGIGGLTEYRIEKPLMIDVASVLFVIGIIIFMPRIIISVWQCRDLEQSPLKGRLELLCKRAEFSHAGLKTWDVMPGSLNAAILGVLGHFRYVIFTEGLLKRLSSDAICAVLAHEIGHSARRHLLFYPILLVGLVLFAEVSSTLLVTWLMDHPLFTHAALSLSAWNIFFPFLNFLLFGFVFAALFRLIFGYFSRLFERQADLHIFELEIPVDHMIMALNEIGIASGNTHNVPCWHHGSILERIIYLEKAAKSKSLRVRHHRLVAFSVKIYFIFLTSFLLLLFFLSR